VTPYRVDPGIARTVVLRGEDMAEEDLARLRLDGAAVNATRVDYTTWNVSLPALAAGEHEFSFPNALGLTRSFARVTARSAVVAPVGGIAETGEKSRVLYDEQRGRIYVLNRTLQAVQRFAWDGAAWAALSAVPVPLAKDIDFDRTGRELYALADGSLYRIALDEVTPVATPWLPSVGHEANFTQPEQGYLGVLDSGIALVTQQFPGSGGSETLVVDMLRGDQPLSTWGLPLYVAVPYEGRIDVSPDGRYAAIGEWASAACLPEATWTWSTGAPPTGATWATRYFRSTRSAPATGTSVSTLRTPCWLETDASSTSRLPIPIRSA
jgi:hypothetical protein